MHNKKISKLLFSALVITSLLTLSPTTTKASTGVDIGWKQYGSTWRYLNCDNSPKTGWISSCGKWYYTNNNGDMVTGWKKIGPNWYYLNSNGDMATGWKHLGHTWYFLNSDGSMATGWRKLGANWYYLNSDGSMACYQMVDGYYLDKDGSMKTESERTILIKNIGMDNKGNYYISGQYFKMLDVTTALEYQAITGNVITKIDFSPNGHPYLDDDYYDLPISDDCVIPVDKNVEVSILNFNNGISHNNVTFNNLKFDSEYGSKYSAIFKDGKIVKLIEEYRP